MSERKQWVMDMTEGSITKIILKFSIPLLLGNLFQQVYNVVDSVVVGRVLGPEALGGVGSIGMINFFLFSLCFGLSAGIGVNVSNCYGLKQYDKLKRMIANSFYLLIAVGLMMGIFGFTFAGPILRLMNTPNENFIYAFTYMRITCGLTIAVTLYNGISSMLRAMGDSKTPLIFLVVSSVMNVILDIFFVVIFKMGVAGAAYATVFSQLVSGVGCILFAVKTNEYFKLNKEQFALDKAILLEHLRIGLPMSFQEALIAISCTLLQALINGFGPVAMAGYTAGNRVENLFFQPFGALGAAVSTFSGQNMGAKRYDRIKKVVLISEGIVLVYSAAALGLVFLFKDPLIRLFVNDDAVVAIGGKGLLISAMGYLGLGTIYTFRGGLNGMRDVVFSMANGILEVVLRVSLAFLLMRVLAMDCFGVWYNNSITWYAIGLIAVGRFYYFERRVESGKIHP